MSIQCPKWHRRRPQTPPPSRKAAVERRRRRGHFAPPPREGYGPFFSLWYLWLEALGGAWRQWGRCLGLCRTAMLARGPSV